MKKGAYAVIINHDKELLLTKKKEVYILPGGKHDEGEDDLTCLAREVGEELNGAQIKTAVHYKDIPGTTPHSNTDIMAHTYIVTLADILHVKASREISEILRTREFDKYNLSEITKKVIACLKEDWLL